MERCRVLAMAVRLMSAGGLRLKHRGSRGLTIGNDVEGDADGEWYGEKDREYSTKERKLRCQAIVPSLGQRKVRKGLT
jgi:hypothetical protein